MAHSTMLLVRSDALPEVFSKVALVKEKLSENERLSVSDAIREVGISRSAFYKYRDSVFSPSETGKSDISNLFLMLKDESGALAGVITAVSSYGANILTINQSVPKHGVASVTISFTHNSNYSKNDFINSVTSISQVVSASIQ